MEFVIITKKIKRAAKKKLLKLGETKLNLLTKPFYGGIGHILLFHRIVPTNIERDHIGTGGLEVSTDFLEDTIQFFRDRNYKFISLDKLWENFQNNQFEKKFVVFTFDDGYLDNLTHAYPIFKKHKIPFAIYITTNFPDKKAILYWYILEDLLKENTVFYFEVDNKKFEFDCSTIFDKRESFQKIRDIILAGNQKNFFDRIKQIFANYDVDLYEKVKKLAMNWEQIRDLSGDELVTIGAHTVNHYPLNKLPETLVEKEIIQSKDAIESQINQKVEHFAYPYGTIKEAGHREFDIVKEMGFKTATTVREANIFPEHKNHLEALPRVPITARMTLKKLEAFTNGWIPLIENKTKIILKNKKNALIIY
jgi:peptidoglycan/xylan/chitin deacetylase (PgdA/CDA1 family)